MKGLSYSNGYHQNPIMNFHLPGFLGLMVLARIALLALNDILVILGNHPIQIVQLVIYPQVI
jgi:hypothetical protein